MKIVYQPASELSRGHDCGNGLYDLGLRPAGTIAACICGNRWEAVQDTFGNWLRLRLWATRPMRGGSAYRPDLVWRLHSHVVADWDDVADGGA